MNKTLSLTMSALLTSVMPVFAEETRQLDAHEHGVGALNIAFDQGQVAIEFRAPGADIVGFEYSPSTEADRAAVDAAVATLARPLDLFVVPQAAACSVTQASAGLVGDLEDEEHGHDEHGHEEHAEDEHDHAEHGHDKDEHAEQEHAEHGHDDHGHDDHGEDAHEEHAEEAGHTEFRAEYLLTCAEPDALEQIEFAYFEVFPNALEVEVQVITASGANAFEATRTNPVLSLKGAF